MAEENAEICGFLDVKYLGNKCKVHRVRKRTLASWKVWKRHWCSIKKIGPGLGVKVQLDYGISNGGTASLNGRDNAIIIPLDAVVCRAQSRSKQFAFGIFPIKERKPLLYLAGTSEIETQRWMANIRQLLKPRKHQFVPGSYNISIVDNIHSKASGLTGLYGDLIASTIGIFIKDAYSGEIIQTFEWKELGQFHLSTAGRPEDVKCICVIHTTKEFRGGAGELHVFCLEASKLLQDLVTQGRGPRNKQINRRPLSLSEGDLRITICDDASKHYPLFSKKIELRITNDTKGSNLACGGMSCRTHDHLMENFYQPEPASVPNISGCSSLSNPHNRRVSDISIASGIYEEIADDADSSNTTSNFYIDRIFLNRQLEEPPPLPPRQRCASESMKGSRLSYQQSILISQRSLVSATDQTTVQSEDKVASLDKSFDEALYVPMSPRLKDITLHNIQTEAASQENDYVVMR